MRMLFIKSSNVAIGELIDPGKTFIEKSGYHMAPPNAIYRHEVNKDESIVIVPQGRIVAFGGEQNKEFIDRELDVIDVSKYMGNKPTVDSEIRRWLGFLFKNAGPVLIIIIAIGILLSMANTGGI